MKIHLLRHAKANQDTQNGLDLERDLSLKGINQAKKLSNLLSVLENCDIFCSSSKRTRQTFDLVFLDKIFKSIHFSQDLYLASSKQILKLICEIKSKNDLFIIGHNNGISDFASYISGDNIYFKTCEYYCFNVEIDSWSELSEGTAKLIENYRPEV